MLETVAENINILGDFCGKRDVAALNQEELKNKFAIDQADLMVLFGGSILQGGQVLAEAIKNKVAKKYVIVGGAGHTTQALRDIVQAQCPMLQTENLSEAQIFADYISYKYAVEVDFLETESTNCGNNITYLLDLLRKNKLSFNSIILSQDATMQYRMEAVLRKHVKDVLIINFATYAAKVRVEDSRLVYQEDFLGMWDMDRYISLLLGEIPRLTDDENGYGPKGKDFLVSIAIPERVKKAFDQLSILYPDLIRQANPDYASK